MKKDTSVKVGFKWAFFESTNPTKESNKTLKMVLIFFAVVVALCKLPDIIKIFSG